VRWDGGIEVGSEVGLFYDPMLAKLIVHAATREQAVDRMHRALRELAIDGVETSRDFHLRVMEDAEFRRGDISIQWLERRLASLTAPAVRPGGARLAAIVAALLTERDRGVRPATVSASATAPSVGASEQWKLAARREGLRVQ
jgi:acetyl-CoA carboxylase biotin carboxylase subunit